MTASSIKETANPLNIIEARKLLLNALSDPELSIDALSIYRYWLGQRVYNLAPCSLSDAAYLMNASPATARNGLNELVARGYLEAGELA